MRETFLLILVFVTSLPPHPARSAEMVAKSELKPFAKGSCDTDPDANPWLKVASRPKEKNETESRILVSVIPSYPRLFKAVDTAHYKTRRGANNEVSLELISGKDRVFSDPTVDCSRYQLNVDMLNADDELVESLSLDLETGVLRGRPKKK